MQIVSCGKMLGLANKGKGPRSEVGCCSRPLLSRAGSVRAARRKDTEGLGYADPSGPRLGLVLSHFG